MAPRLNTSATRPKKFKIKRSHGFMALLWIFGTVFPPIAVAIRFGIGVDFFINLVLTLCGYIPGHIHNFYIQNIRNNKNNRRTPKWAIRYGLIDDAYLKRKQKKSAWANRYDERLPNSTLEGREVEEGQERDPTAPVSPVDSTLEGRAQNGTPGDARLWREEEESFYSNNDNEPSGRWHYPANFEDVELVPDVSRKKRKSSSGTKKRSSKKADRWERSEEAYAGAAAPPPARKSSRRRKSDQSFDGPEDPLGAGYGRANGNGRREDDLQAGSYESGGLDDVRRGNGSAGGGGGGAARADPDDGSLFSHEF